MKTICPLCYHHNGFVTTHALRHVRYGYTLLVLTNQRAFNKLRKKHNISGLTWSTKHRALKSHRSKTSIICRGSRIVTYMMLLA